MECWIHPRSSKSVRCVRYHFGYICIGAAYSALEQPAAGEEVVPAAARQPLAQQRRDQLSAERLQAALEAFQAGGFDALVARAVRAARERAAALAAEGQA